MYLSSDEFLDLERARLTLRAHGIAADRGRLVREAIALLMTDLEAGIDASVIARRLREAGQPIPADGAPAAEPANSGPAADPPNGAPATEPANGGPVKGGFVNGALTGIGSANGGVAGGGPAGGVWANGGQPGDGPVGLLANGIGATGPPEGPQ